MGDNFKVLCPWCSGEMAGEAVEKKADSGLLGATAENEDEKCPRCGQEKKDGYLSVVVPLFITVLGIRIGIQVRVLYSSTCGFLKLKVVSG